jgi:hypothetical protein
VANTFGDRKIYVVVTPNPDWAWADVGAMVMQMIIETGITVLTAGAAAPVEAGAIAASAARLGRLAQGVNTIKRVVALVQEMKIFKACTVAFEKSYSAYDTYDKLSMTFGAAEATAMRNQNTAAIKSLHDYLDKNAIVIGPGEYKQVNCTNYLEVFNAMNPSYWGAISGCSTVQLLVLDENLEHVATFNTGADNSWIVTSDAIVRSIYGSIWQQDAASGTQGWTPPVPPTPPVPSAGDCIVGLGTDTKLYARSRLSSDWVEVPGSATRSGIVSISAMPDGTLLGVGSDKRLWTKASLTSHDWIPVPNSGDVTAAVGLADGVIAGVGTDMALWLRPTLTGSWTRANNNNTTIKGLTVLGDGSLVAVGTNGGLWTRTYLNTAWVSIPQSGTVKSATAMPDNSIVAVGTDNNLWSRPTLTNDWVHVLNSGTVTSATYLPPLPALIGVGPDNLLWTRASLTAGWEQVQKTGPVIAATVMADGAVIGVGTDNGLWRRPALYQAWMQVVNSGGVVSVTAFPDGSLVAVGTDNRLKTRPMLYTSGWTEVPGRGDFLSVLALVDNSLLAVGTDHGLWTQATPSSEWVQIPNSGSVKCIAAMRDGAIVGVGLDDGLWTWKDKTWSPVPGTAGTVTSIYVPR